MFILAKENNLHPIFGIHRLDRLTSGLLLFARSKDIANKYAEQIRNGQVHKLYIAKVEGEFSKEPVDVNQPIVIRRPGQGINECKDDGKPCRTIFHRISFNSNSNTSIVKCEPQQGRTHQIRVHLNWLGFPIANDPVYGKGKRSQVSTVPNSLETVVDPDCPECILPRLDPEEEQLCLWLHAISYEGKDWKYETDLPNWVTDESCEAREHKE